MAGILLNPDPSPPKRTFLYLPSEYKHRRNITVAGEAESGEISPKGQVVHSEDWEGRITPTALPSPVRMVFSVGENRFRPMTHAEAVDRGYFVVGSGPADTQHIEPGIVRE